VNRKNLILPIIFIVFSFINSNADDSFIAQNTIEQKHIVVIVPSYNNQHYYKKNLDSIFSQDYDNFRVIYIDDQSQDRTAHLVRSYIEKRDLWHHVTLVENQQRRGALANLYDAIHSCQDSDIVVTVDGDDWLAHPQVLKIINCAYADPNVWITFGQFRFHPDGRKGYCRDIEPHEFTRDRRWCHVATHMRTFYAGLFKKIKKEDLMINGRFFEVTWDKAMMAPMLEMANRRWKFIPDIVYVYNLINPLSDARLYGEQQVATAEIIYAKEQYLPLSGPLPY
jgi:glycosyltransferase involved in cell wall biosynthesis